MGQNGVRKQLPFGEQIRRGRRNGLWMTEAEESRLSQWLVISLHIALRVSTRSCPEIGRSSWEGNAALHEDSLGSSIFTSPGDARMVVFYECR